MTQFERTAFERKNEFRKNVIRSNDLVPLQRQFLLDNSWMKVCYGTVY